MGAGNDETRALAEPLTVAGTTVGIDQLHVAGAGARRAARRPDGLVLARARALRDGDAGIRRSPGRRPLSSFDAILNRQPDAAIAAQSRKCPASSIASSVDRSRRTPRCGTRRPAISRRTCGGCGATPMSAGTARDRRRLRRHRLPPPPRRCGRRCSAPMTAAAPASASGARLPRPRRLLAAAHALEARVHRRAGGSGRWRRRILALELDAHAGIHRARRDSRRRLRRTRRRTRSSTTR